MLTTSRRRGAGFTLIEVMVVLTISAYMLVMMVRAFGTWSADSRVRATTESLLSALRVTQAYAVSHNRVTAFSLTSGTPAYNATSSSTGSNWFSVPVPLLGSDETSVNLGMILSSTMATGYKVSLAGSNGTGGGSTSPVCFNSLGQLASQPNLTTQTALSANCTMPSNTAPVTFTVTGTGAVRQYKVLVFPAGQLRMCDALKTLSSTNPDGCP